MNFALTVLSLSLTLMAISCKPHESSTGLSEQESGWGKNTEIIAGLQLLNDKLTDAYQREDIPILRDLLSANHVHNNVFGSRLTKDEFLKDIESGTLEFESYTTPEIEWYVTGDLAVATGVIEASAIRAGKPVPATTFRFTRIFNREEGQWKVLLFQNAMVPKEPANPQP